MKKQFYLVLLLPLFLGACAAVKLPIPSLSIPEKKGEFNISAGSGLVYQGFASASYAFSNHTALLVSVNRDNPNRYKRHQIEAGFKYFLKVNENAKFAITPTYAYNRFDQSTLNDGINTHFNGFGHQLSVLTQLRFKSLRFFQRSERSSHYTHIGLRPLHILGKIEHLETFKKFEGQKTFRRNGLDFVLGQEINYKNLSFQYFSSFDLLFYQHNQPDYNLPTRSFMAFGMAANVRF